jgi:hypothetical protein
MESRGPITRKGFSTIETGNHRRPFQRDIARGLHVAPTKAY